MSMFEVERPESIQDINYAIYNFFVGLTSIFVRPHGAEIQQPDQNGEVRLHSLYIEQLDSKGIHHRTNEIKSIGAGEDVYIRSVSEDVVNGLMNELSIETGLDIGDCNCYYVLTQVDVYLPKGESLASIEANSIHDKVMSSLQRSPFAVESFRVLKAARSRHDDFSDRPRLTKKGFDRISVDYNLLLAEVVTC